MNSLGRSLLAIGALSLAGAGLLWGVPYWQLQQQPKATQLQVPPCDITKGRCELRSEAFNGHFSLGPAPLQSLKTLHASLSIQGAKPDEVLLSLEGRDMYMGINQTALTPDTNSANWRGTTELAVCTTGSMIWRAHLTILLDGVHYAGWFDFEAK
ncbi:MAG: hypothetical protein CMI01_16225 [Oceanospirillaceae bacterium]|nr:hypothetical protein [Oceanospirillaceae bacterium]